MKDLRGRDFGYPLMNLAETYIYHTAFPVEWEEHTSWEIHHILSGSVTYELDNGNTLALRGGTFLVIPPRTRHRTINGSAAPSTRLATRWSPQKPGVRQGQSPLFLAKKDIAHIFSDLAASGLVVRQMTRDMLHAAKELFNQVNAAEAKPTGFSAALLRHRCNDMLINLALAASAPEPISKDKDVVKAVQHYIDEHLGVPLKMKDLVHISGYGATQLTKLFQDRLGLTPNGYLIRARIQKACDLLKAGEGSVTEIALACGFSSASYFSTVFRKYRGTAPLRLHSRIGAVRIFSCAGGAADLEGRTPVNMSQ